MRLNLERANRVHDWLIKEGRECHSQRDVDPAVDRFLETWPRLKPDVLQYVSEMLIAQLHPRTFYPLRILKRAGERTAHGDPGYRRRWWQIGLGTPARRVDTC
jgi:hypothetical protein